MKRLHEIHGFMMMMIMMMMMMEIMMIMSIIKDLVPFMYGIHLKKSQPSPSHETTMREDGIFYYTVDH